MKLSCCRLESERSSHLAHWKRTKNSRMRSDDVLAWEELIRSRKVRKGGFQIRHKDESLRNLSKSLWRPLLTSSQTK